MKSKCVRKDDKGVSPVIATILMVAITVVLAAVLYLMVSSFGGGDTSQVSGTISVEKDSTTQAYIRFGKFSPTQDPLDVTIVINNGTEQSSYVFDSTGEEFVIDGTDDANTGSPLDFTTQNVDEINNGDRVYFTYDSGSEYEIQIFIDDDEVATATLG